MSALAVVERDIGRHYAQIDRDEKLSAFIDKQVGAATAEQIADELAFTDAGCALLTRCVVEVLAGDSVLADEIRAHWQQIVERRVMRDGAEWTR